MSSWAIICPFTLPSLTARKMKLSKMKKISPYIIILYKCTKIMTIGYIAPEIWRLRDVIVFLILGYTFPFYPPNSPKIKISKGNKWIGDIIILHRHIKNHDHMLLTSSDMEHDKCTCYFSLGAIFCTFTTLTCPKKSKFQKIENKSWRYHHFTQVYQKSGSTTILHYTIISKKWKRKKKPRRYHCCCRHYVGQTV